MDSIILYGAGRRCEKLYSLLKQSTLKIDSIIDSDIKKQGCFIGDVMVESPEILRKKQGKRIYITVADQKIQDVIRNMLYKEYNYDCQNEVTYEELILAIYERNDSINRIIEQYEIPKEKDNSIIFDCYNGLGLGGVESWTKDICEALIKNNYKNIYIMSKKGEYEISPMLKSHVIYFEMDSIKRYGYESIAQIVNLLLNCLPCKVITSTTNEIMVAAYLVKRYYPDLIEIISVIHNSNKLVYKSYLNFKRYSDLYIGVSQDIKSDLIQRGMDARKILTMTCPFPCLENIDRTYTIDIMEPIHIGYAGRMDGFEHSQKRMDILLKLIKELVDRNLNFTMELAGDGPARTQMECYIHENALENKIIFLGTIDRKEIPNFWRRQDICVNTADYEGRSISIIEAMGNGAVPIVTMVSGTREDIIDDENGYLIPLEDYKTMADKIEYLARNRDRLSTMGKMAHDIVYPKSLMSEHLKFWNTIL